MVCIFSNSKNYTKILVYVSSKCNGSLLFVKGLEKNISARCLDVTNKASILDLAKEVEKIDILFNCAGYDYLICCN